MCCAGLAVHPSLHSVFPVGCWFFYLTLLLAVCVSVCRECHEVGPRFGLARPRQNRRPYHTLPVGKERPEICRWEAS
ncbi:hypothetical protein QBC37DRAFT_432121 [Rhypophila decipiens]|uniref:Uncharacterized protein n=1 Tax=Rhypophila decipiens TaxID=261697 RepID=A0AAN6Y2X6_9PEZI|nr:hypothetical protein QBC37DRAFT_432121 [Rhypophila decipiens]